MIHLHAAVMQEQTTSNPIRSNAMHELLAKVAHAGVRLEPVGDDLRVVGPLHALTPELRQALRDHKPEIVDRLRNTGSVARVESLPELVAEAGDRTQPFPLTDVQHAYWMGRRNLVELGQVATHFYLELDCARIDCGRLNDALQRLIERHDMMRAVIDAGGMQRILPEVPPYRICIQDATTATLEEAEGAILATREEMSHETLPADQWPLFDVRATLLADGRTRLHVSLDMLTMDASSMFVLFREWEQLYSDPECLLPEIDISFRDYVLAERRLLGSATYEKARQYWEARVDSLPRPPELPIKAIGVNPSEAPRFSRRRMRLDSARWSRLKARAREEGLTPSGVLLAAYADVLTRWSTVPHYTLNLTLFNRLPLHPHVGRLIGDFTSLTMLEVDHRDRARNFRCRAAALQQRLMNDLEHREFGGVQVLREWTQRQHAGLYAAMPVVFTSGLVLGGGETGRDASLVERFGPMVYGISQTPQVWLDNQVTEIAGDLAVNWDAVEAMFEPGVLDAMFEAYISLLVRLGDDRACWEQYETVDLPARMIEARHEGRGEIQPPQECVLHAGFLEHASRTPHAPAVISNERILTYRMLLAESLAVAHWLQCQGLQRGELVGVVMHKGWEQAVAVLGVLMAGGAYMPVDASLPMQRQEELLQIGEVRCILTQPVYTQWREDHAPSRRFAVHEITAGESTNTREDMAQHARVQADDLAYVIFTSGTTGKPKGVMTSHKAACNTVTHVNAMLGLTNSDRILSVSSLSFDLSVYDLFGVLNAGAALVLPDAGRHLDAAHWRELLELHHVTVWNSAPQLMRMLVESFPENDEVSTAPLRAVLLSGDWIPVDLPRRLRAHYPSAQIVSLGGATEASIWSIYYPIIHVDPRWTSIPYGKALPNQTMQVLNAHFDECPDFVKGRIYIGGAGLAEGYWGDPERTAQRFIFHPGSGERLYDTGDLGRYLADGNIEFMGRDDDQVKIRGHRVEPGEVSSVLRQHPEIEEAVVIPTGSRDHRQLAAYVQLIQGSIEELGRCETVSAPMPLAELLRPAISGTHSRALDCELQAVWSRLDDYYLAAVIVALRKLGVTGTPGEVMTPQDILARGVAERYQRWLSRAFDAMCADGTLCEIGGGIFEVTREWDTADLSSLSAEIRQRLSSILGFSDEEALWFTDAVENLEDILTERIHSAEIYAAESTARIYQKLFPDSHAQLSRVIHTLASDCKESLSVMELGAGLGSATRHVLPALAAASCRYLFTDISDYFLKNAREAFSGWDMNIEFARFDVDRPPEFQGIDRHSFDLVLASSMLHDVSDIQMALHHITGLLKPGGRLVLLEETRFFRSFDLHMGLQQGFDCFTDTHLRTRHCLLTAEQWTEVLVEAGFTDVLIARTSGTAVDYLGFHVIVATSPLRATTLDTRAVQAYLGSRLPDYMVPQHIVQMERFPVTPNGKLNYKALPAVPEAAFSMPGQIAPRNELEEMIREVWVQILGEQNVGVTDNFFDLGGDSLIATQIVREIGLHAQVVLEVHEFLYAPTVEAVAALIQSRMNEGALPEHGAPSPAEEVFPSLEDSAAVLDDLEQLHHRLPAGDIGGRSVPLASAVTVLLTGATGWVGAYLLKELLSSTNANVACVVRAKDGEDGLSRIVANLRRYNLSLSDAEHVRIVALAGELSKPQFGLDDDTWNGLCNSVDHIFHVAASVDTVANYQSVRTSNVLPVIEVVKLAKTVRPKSIAFASTQAVCIRCTGDGFVVYPDETASSSPAGLLIGYAQSKWIAEKLLLESATDNAAVKIFRIPHVLPALDCPVISQDNILGAVLGVACTVGAVPDWENSSVEGITVDVLARLIMYDALHCSSRSGIAHVALKKVPTLSEVIRVALAESGQESPQLVCMDRWLDLCRQTIRNRKHQANVIAARLFEQTDAGVALCTLFSQRVNTAYFDAHPVPFSVLPYTLDADYWSWYLSQFKPND
ncbi:amino acid adenylation domain-containing protein [Herbaspirillum sp. HC18]|nr:amino acid adenylation domain-containing protein [Herbaspirillum sp. HC18]